MLHDLGATINSEINCSTTSLFVILHVGGVRISLARCWCTCFPETVTAGVHIFSVLYLYVPGKRNHKYLLLIVAVSCYARAVRQQLLVAL